jgi:PAS domain S-box-containing protein
MRDERKKKDQLIKELKELRQRVIELEASDADRNPSVKQKKGEFFEGIVANTLDIIIVTDTKGYIVDTNKAFEQLLGYNNKEAIGKHMSEYALPSEGTYESTEGTQVRISRGYLDKIATAVSEFAKNEKIYNWEVYFIRKDKKLVPVEQSAIYLYDKRGEKTAAVSIARDITQRKKAEKAIRELKDHLENIIESSLDYIAVSDSRGNLTRVNKAFLDLIGYREKEVIGRHIAELTPTKKGTYKSTTGEMVKIDKEFFDCTLKAIEKLYKEGKVTGWESYFLHKDGRVVPVERSVVYLDVEEGYEGGAVGIGRDITERKIKEKELRESNEKYHTLMETANDAIFIADAETGIITDANKKAEELSGIPVEDIIGMHQTQLHPKEDAEYYRTIFADDIQKGEGIIRGDIFIYHKTGHKIPVELSASVAKVGGKNIIQGIFRDMRDYKRAEEELIQTKDYLENIIEGSSDCIVVVDSNACIVKVNKSFLGLLGYKEEEVIGKNMVAFPPKTEGTYESTGGELIEINERFVNNFEETNKKLLKEGKVNNWDTYFVRNDKKIVPVELNIDVLFNSAKEPIGAVGIVRDITERKSAERRIKELMERYRNLVEHANDAIISTNKDGKIIVFNKKAEEIFGYTREEILNKSVALLSIPSERENVIKGVEEYKGSNKVSMVAKIIEGKGLKKNGRQFSVETSFVAQEIGGEYIFTGITRDISERKKVEKKLVDYQRRLKSLTSQMTLTEEKDRRRFAEYLHDQIGQKLFSLNLKLEEIRNSSANDNCSGVIDNSFKIIKQLIHDTRSLTFELSPPILYQLGLGPALEWLTEQTREEYGIKVAFEDDEQEKELSDDIKVLLFQAVRELLVNVAKHAKAQNAKVSIKRDDKHLRVCVEDDGVGFTPSYGEGFRTADGGFGLFSIGERLDFLGGQFNLESESGRGTRVMMVAPLKDEK